MSSGVAARAAEERKHSENDGKCKELGWRCIPLVVETYGAWGSEATQVFSIVAPRLAVRTNSSKSLKGSGHLIWPSELDFGTAQCWSYLDEIPAIICP